MQCEYGDAVTLRPGPLIRNTMYIVHFADGRRSAPLGQQAVRQKLEAGEIGPGDRLAVGTSTPRKVSQFSVFDDLTVTLRAADSIAPASRPVRSRRRTVRPPKTTVPPAVSRRAAVQSRKPEPPAPAPQNAVEEILQRNQAEEPVERAFASPSPTVQHDDGAPDAPAVSPRPPTTPRWQGSDTHGDLVYNVGTPREVLAQTLIPFALLFALVVGLLLGSRWENVEGGIGEGATRLPIARATLLTIAAIVGVLAIRGEGLKRLGFRVYPHSAMLSLGVVLLAPVVGYFVVPYGIHPAGAPTLGVLLALVGLRAVTEALFFEGFVVRSLLIGFEQPAVPVVIGAATYALWVNSYAFLWDPSSDVPAFGAVRLSLFVAVPAALVMYRSRAWWLAAIVRVLALGGAAYAAWVSV